MVQVYECRSSYEDDRPQIDFTVLENCKIDWLKVGEVVDGTVPVNEFPPVSIQVLHPDAINWDCFMVPGTRGLFSQRFADAVGAVAFQGLTLLPAKLNATTTYYFLRAERPIDCLDRSHAVFETFRSDRTAIKKITHYVFHSELLPTDACFVLPELPDLLLTECVVERLQAANLKGVRIQPLP